MIRNLLLGVVFFLYAGNLFAEKFDYHIWEIGVADGKASEFALSPDRFKDFIYDDFGYEDKYFIVNHSSPGQDFPYVLPGPVDTWGGTWPTSGWRTHYINILFCLENNPTGDYMLELNLSDFSKRFLPLIKISINGQDSKFQLETDEYSIWKQRKPTQMERAEDTLSLTGDLSKATPYNIQVPIDKNVLKKGSNLIAITTLEGSWILFDNVILKGTKPAKVNQTSDFYVRNVEAASYQLMLDNKAVQPLIVDVEHLKGEPQLDVILDGSPVFSKRIEKGRYQFEVPMPAVGKKKTGRYSILCNGEEICTGKVLRAPHNFYTPADYVDTRIGTAHSRWMIAPGPWMPFSMVKLSPDNQNRGWQAGYEPSFENIGCFSHIHEWTLGGLGIMPANGELEIKVGDEQKPDEGYRSRIDKRSEKAGIGYYSVELSDYDIKAELTATTRCGFERFTFPVNRGESRILVEFHPELEYDIRLQNISVKKINDYRIEGSIHQYSPQVWSNDAEQDYVLNFVLEFDRPILRLGSWCNGEISDNIDGFEHGKCEDAGLIVTFDPKTSQVVQVRSGISLVSVANASENLEREITSPFGWNFDAVCKNQKDVWNELFGRLEVKTDDRLEKVKFYNHFYRAMCGRNIWSDINGEWISTDGTVRKVANPETDVMLGSDAFWNTFWNLNIFWNLVTPEWTGKWVRSQLAMYDANGWLSKGPAGLNYIPVMVAEHEISLIVSAWQMGIRDFDPEKALEACVKMQTIPAQKVFKGFAGNRDLEPYMKYHYVPYNLGRFSNTMEYSYDDWCVGQLAKSLGDTLTYNIFNERGDWWKNVINSDGYCAMKDSNGEWLPDFDPFRSGANKHYVEGNAWQLTFFVPQDIPALVDYIGEKRFTDRLEWGFHQDEAFRYNAPNDQYWDHPIVQGNQQSMHFAFLFNFAGQPWNTQKWSRSILDRYYGSGYANAYLGDEDQGQMSAWAIMASIGLFQTDGGCATTPMYEIASPVFEEVKIDLGRKYGRGKDFYIIAKNASRKNIYIQSAELNGKRLDTFRFPASELLKGGKLVLVMGDSPNKSWGIHQ